MAAIACELLRHDDVDAMRRLVGAAGDLGRAIARGMRRGIEEPLEAERQ